MYLALAFLGVMALANTTANSEKVSCREIKKSDGNLGFDCATVVPTTDLTAQNLYILWLKSGARTGDQFIDINLPNYKISDVIQAAAKGEFGSAHTKINVNLEKPELVYQAQKQDNVGQISQTFDVNLLYDKINGRAVHFADEGAGSERYTLLREAVQEPTQNGNLHFADDGQGSKRSIALHGEKVHEPTQNKNLRLADDGQISESYSPLRGEKIQEPTQNEYLGYADGGQGSKSYTPLRGVKIQEPTQNENLRYADNGQSKSYIPLRGEKVQQLTQNGNLHVQKYGKGNEAERTVLSRVETDFLRALLEARIKAVKEAYRSQNIQP